MKERNSGVGFSGLLTITLIVLKLTHLIDWSWWWVLSPLWIPLAILFSIGILVVLSYSIVKLINYII